MYLHQPILESKRWHKNSIKMLGLGRKKLYKNNPEKGK
jgi:hypothetical protein